MKIFIYLVIAVEVLLGGGSTVAIVGLMLATIGRKIYGKMKYGNSLYQ
jgi:hypothetical protein